MDDFTFREEPGAVSNEVDSVIEDRIYNRLLDPCLKYSEYRKRDLVKELGKRDVHARFWNATAELTREIKADLDNAPLKKQTRALEAKGAAKPNDWRNLKKTMTHLVQKVLVDEEADEKAREASQDDDQISRVGQWFVDSVDGVLSVFTIPENERYNDWQVELDNAFAKTYGAGVPTSLNASPAAWCGCCQKLKITDRKEELVKISLAELSSTAESCTICALVLRLSLDRVNDNGEIYLYRTHAGFRAGSGGQRLIRFSADPGFSGRIKHRIPVGRPLLLNDDRPSQTQLLRSWIDRCDGSHQCNNQSDKVIFPTRVLDVGGLEDMAYAPGWIRLTHAEERKTDVYVALSHCWGALSAGQKEAFCTSLQNLPERKKGFHVSMLPKTFQDAVKIVRALGLRYLWIDSLCIIQSGDKGEDWRREAAQMKNVFSQAYCIIAATAAEDSLSGFLNRARGETEYVCVRDTSGQDLYMSNDIDDFDKDVGDAPLNTRAWVMQESVLARRTIHFSKNQMYWECGEEIYCENLNKLKSPPRDRYFTMDPDFPTRLLQSSFNDPIMNCIFFLLKEYSRRNISFPKDRPVAISGLEERIAEALFCESRFAVFARFLHRNLLWQASGEKTARIEYDDPVPSWSWLSYSGNVGFRDDEAGSWELNKCLKFHPERREALLADLGTLEGCTLRSNNSAYTFCDDSGTQRGWLDPDIKEGDEFDKLHYIVVAKFTNKKKVEQYLVLAVVSNGTNDEYRRVGIGAVDSTCIIKVQENVCIV